MKDIVIEYLQAELLRIRYKIELNNEEQKTTYNKYLEMKEQEFVKAILILKGE